MLDNNNFVKISSIHLKQFMSFNEINLTDLEKYKIIFIMSTNATGKSTLTSEAIYYALFGRSLRFKKIIGLLNRNYLQGSAFAKISLAVTIPDETKYTYFDITKNIQSEPKFELAARNDVFNMFTEIVEIKSVDMFTDSIKRILDLDEKKFSILYLKSPFSESLFESKSTLLASITKVNFFNELRDDFQGIVRDLKSNVEYKQNTLNQQKNLLTSTKQQLERFILNKESESADIQLLNELRTNLAARKKAIETYAQRKRKATENRNIRQKELNDLISLNAKISASVDQKRESYKKLKKLVDAGKCQTCEQVIAKNLYDNQLNVLHEDALKLKEHKKKVQNDLITIKEKVNEIIKFIDDTHDKEQIINNHIITFNNQIAQIDNRLKSNENKQKSDDLVLDEINKTIVTINDDIVALERDYNILNEIFTKLLKKKGDYINRFYNQKISNFTNVYKKLLLQFTNGKYTKVTIDMDNYPVFNDTVSYESLSTSERKYVDIAFVMSYIAYLSVELKFKTFVLDEFFDNFDQSNIIHIYNIIYDIAESFNLQIFITSNIADYIFSTMPQYVSEHPDVKIINLREEIGLSDKPEEIVYDN